jgi:MFS family permease
MLPPPFPELRLAVTLSGVIALRMLGLFLVLPVFMVLASDVPGFTPQLGGLAVGIYGLTQALLQQPFGWLSDRWGRRGDRWAGPFAVGGVMAAMRVHDFLVCGRALQGGHSRCGHNSPPISSPGEASACHGNHRHGYRGAFLLSMVASVPRLTCWGFAVCSA